MKRFNLRGRYAYSTIGIKLLQWFILMFLLTAMAIALWLALWHGRGDIVSLKWFQALQTIGTMLLPPLLVAYLWSCDSAGWLCLSKRVDGWTLLVSVVLMLLCSPLINLLSIWNQQMTFPSFLTPIEQWMRAQEAAAAQLTEQFIIADSLGVLMVNIVLMALLPALSEEFTFRGVLQRLITPSSHQGTPHLAIWVTAIIFSAVHCQFYGFIPRMLMGVLFGYMLAWTGSLWIPVTMHLVNNATAVIGYNIVLYKGYDTALMERFGTGDTWWMSVVSVVVVAVSIYFVRRRSTTINNASSRMSGGN